MRYDYFVLEFPVDGTSPERRLGSHPDMERIYFPDWLNTDTVKNALADAGGNLWAAWYGGMFGLETNRFIVVSVGESEICRSDFLEAIGPSEVTISIVEHQHLTSTVRPIDPTPIERGGFFVFRWLRLVPGSIPEWTDLCNQTWPNFQRDAKSECLAVWQAQTTNKQVEQVLMCTWYEDLSAWESSREVDPGDAPKWRRRAEMEYNHWGIGARRLFHKP